MLLAATKSITTEAIPEPCFHRPPQTHEEVNTDPPWAGSGISPDKEAA
jgi:hypothetical protein